MPICCETKNIVLSLKSTCEVALNRALDDESIELNKSVYSGKASTSGGCCSTSIFCAWALGLDAHQVVPGPLGLAWPAHTETRSTVGGGQGVESGMKTSRPTNQYRLLPCNSNCSNGPMDQGMSHILLEIDSINLVQALWFLWYSY
jgi:hypothetical protein